MKVSIIIPCWNEHDQVALAVHSAWQAGADEVIVVDGGSEDGTWEQVQRLPCRALQSARGRALQQNCGAQRAQGQVLLFLHADCRLSAGCVEQVRRAMKASRAPGGAFRQRIDAPGLGFRLLEWGNALRVRWWQRPYGDQALFVRREVFWHLGGFPPVPLLEDVLLAQKVARFGRWLLLPGPVWVSARRWLRQGLVRQTVQNWLLLAAWHRGVPLEELARRYRPVR